MPGSFSVAAARKGDDAVIQSTNIKKSIQRTREAQKRVVANARVLRSARNAPGRVTQSSPSLSLADNDNSYANDNELSHVDDKQSLPPVPPMAGGISRATVSSSRLPQSRDTIQTGRRTPLRVGTVSNNLLPDANNADEQEGPEKPERDVAAEQYQREQERVRRIRQTQTYGFLTMQEGFAKKLEELKDARATLFQYAPALPFALFKDVSDLIFIGSLPGLGTVISFCCSVAIFFILFLGRVNKKLIDSRFLLRMVVALALGTLIEFLPGLNFLPIETVTVFTIYAMDKHLSDKKIAAVTEALKGIEGKTK